MMLFQDGLPHEWLVGQAPLDLIVTLDDATSAICSVFLVEEEGTASSFRGLEEVISQHGLFSSLYTDRGRFLHHPKGGRHGRQATPDPGGACLGRAADRAHPVLQPGSPRAHGTGFRDVAAAFAAAIAPPRHYHDRGCQPLSGRYLPVRAQRPLCRVGGGRTRQRLRTVAAGLRDILCIKHERVVGRDNCVRYAGRILQIPEQRHRHHFVKAKVQLHEYPDGTMALFHGPRRLAGYTVDATLIQQEVLARSAA
jgi:hypothetical protein